jgi:uncharacterized protein (DUF2236 family)
MACPMGFTAATQEKETPYEKPKIYQTIAEPKELLNYTSDGIFLLGGQYAILCQFAHPGLARGTYEHSNFASRLLNRLQTTARFLNVCVYGTQEEKEAILSVIHRAHSVVRAKTTLLMIPNFTNGRLPRSSCHLLLFMKLSSAS